jgi:hypothetical protein
VKKILYLAVIFSLLSLFIPWTLSGVVNPFEIVEFGMGGVALALLWWRPRIACLIGSIIWLSAVTDFIIQEILGNRESLSTDPMLVAGITSWAISSSAFLLFASEYLPKEVSSDSSHSGRGDD